MKSGYPTAVIQGVAEGQAAWPGVTLDPDRFAAHVTAHVSTSSANLRHLYLACACGAGDEHAVRYVDRMLCQAVERALCGRGFSPSERDEVAQRLRCRLLVPDGGKPPRIFEYSGRGDLGSWLRVAALRLALNFRRQTGREEPLDDTGLAEACACTGQTPDAAYAAAHSRETFVSAFRAAFSALSARERNLLRLHYVDGAELQDLAAAYSVHRVTVGRWIDVARDRLREELELYLVSRLQLRASEAARWVVSVRAVGDLSLRQLLPLTIPRM
ncbi:MAG TPA: hypothetical protein VFB62_24450 [Polyangiaceae bacterium]|jgi:RNA polymerase sigma-70 factor (ECF subfamily)|nr:hypothetical protein [Polyangiaceae bacterium]